ncbi:hypothetical protein BDQ17DRAFT_1407867 [Cyathus striatus]|nr:hypothetical protein BDQ17DRAFT_1407867 [Cyathus striatus]
MSVQETKIAKEIEDYLKGLAEMWPVCESPAPGWSSDWSKWENLNSYFGPSPYYLNLPQVEMLVNIHYGVGGEVVPVLYSNEQDAFIFVLQDDDEATSNFVLFDATANTMKSLPASDVEELKKHMTEHGSSVLDLPGTVIEPDQEGQLVAQAIIKGDERIFRSWTNSFLCPLRRGVLLRRNKQQQLQKLKTLLRKCKMQKRVSIYHLKMSLQLQRNSYKNFG